MSYDIVPLLTLVAASVSLTADVLDILYEATHRVAIPEYKNNTDENLESFKIKKLKN